MNLPFVEPKKRYGEMFASFANFFRDISLVIDEKPRLIKKYCDHPAIQFLINDRDSTTYDRTLYLEALAYGDPGVLLACPGPSLSGLILRELGTEEQINYFYDYLKKNNAISFFALTEPNTGSNAGNLLSNLTKVANHPSKYYLNGEKCLFGNGFVGEIGITFARSHLGPLGIRAILITPEKLTDTKSIIRESLSMAGLQGAQLAYMRFHNVIIDEQDLLGQHLSATQHGMMAIIKTFNRLRTGVGALAIGQAQALSDYVYQTKTKWVAMERKIYKKNYYEIEAARQLLRDAANIVDNDPFNSVVISIAKVHATKVVEKIMPELIDILSPDILLTNEWISKCYRDAFAWEYMEGTRNMQYKNVYHDFQAKNNRES